MIIGIRREDKNPWERRTPLIPEDVANLIQQRGLQFRVQPSGSAPARIFPDQAYADAGAEIGEDLTPCDVVVGVKEIPPDSFREGGTYLFFSHTIKCQPYNMPMLKALLEKRATLLDYELIADDRGRRLVFFGEYAGLAGMIDSLSALGRRLDVEGIPNPFAPIRMAHEYADLGAAQEAITRQGALLNGGGLDERLTPLVVGFAGYGNVSRGAQSILNLMPTISITPEDLLTLRDRDDLSRHHIYQVVFKEEHLVKPRAAEDGFELQDYYDHPERYISDFDRFAPHLNVLINAIYWTEKYPRLITIDALRRLFEGETPPHLRVVGDISCDIGGSIECTIKATTSDAPCYVFDPAKGRAHDGYEGRGPVVMAVDNLPCELPREASEHFSRSLRDFMGEFAALDLTSAGVLKELSAPLRKSVIAFQGQLLEPYRYIGECLDS